MVCFYGEKNPNSKLTWDDIELPENFKQRLEITETILPAISEKIMSPFNKVGRMDNVTKTIEYVGQNNQGSKFNIRIEYIA